MGRQTGSAMHLDVRELRDFWYRTHLGRAAQRAIRDQTTALWPEARGLTVAGFGFAAPLLRPFLAEARRTMALMPGQQGVMAWPPGMENVSALCEETLWPVEDGRIDRLIVMHGIETSEHPIALLEECYRSLAAEGRAIFVVPNRAGLWARREGTPFAFGRPANANVQGLSYGSKSAQQPLAAVILRQPSILAPRFNPVGELIAGLLNPSTKPIERHAFDPVPSWAATAPFGFGNESLLRIPIMGKPVDQILR